MLNTLADRIAAAGVCGCKGDSVCTARLIGVAWAL